MLDFVDILRGAQQHQWVTCRLFQLLTPAIELIRAGLLMPLIPSLFFGDSSTVIDAFSIRVSMTRIFRANNEPIVIRTNRDSVCTFFSTHTRPKCLTTAFQHWRLSMGDSVVNKGLDLAFILTSMTAQAFQGTPQLAVE